MSKLNEVIETTASVAVGITVGVAVPAGILAVVAGAAPASGMAAMTWALKRIGFGAAKRGCAVLGGAGYVSGRCADGATRQAIKVIESKCNSETE